MRLIAFHAFLDRLLFNVNLLYTILRFTDESHGESNIFLPLILVAHHLVAAFPVLMWRCRANIEYFTYHMWSTCSILYTSFIFGISSALSTRAYSTAISFLLGGVFRAEVPCTLYSLYRTNGLRGPMPAKRGIRALEFIVVLSEVVSFMVIPHLWSFDLEYASRYLAAFNFVVLFAGLVSYGLVHHTRRFEEEAALDGPAVLEDNTVVGYVDPALVFESIEDAAKDKKKKKGKSKSDKNKHTRLESSDDDIDLSSSDYEQFDDNLEDLTDVLSTQNATIRSLAHESRANSNQEDDAKETEELKSIQLCVPVSESTAESRTPAPTPTARRRTKRHDREQPANLSLLQSVADRSNGEEVTELRSLQGSVVDKVMEARGLYLIYTLLSIVGFGAFALYALYTFAVGYVLYLVKQTGFVSLGAIVFFASILLIILVSASRRKVSDLSRQLKVVSGIQLGCAFFSWIIFCYKTSEPSFLHIVVHWISTLSIFYVIASPLVMLVDIQFSIGHATTSFADLVLFFRFGSRPLGIIFAWTSFFYFLLPPYLVLGLLAGYLAIQVQAAHYNYFTVSTVNPFSETVMDHIIDPPQRSKTPPSTYTIE